MKTEDEAVVGKCALCLTPSDTTLCSECDVQSPALDAWLRQIGTGA